jgi:hypothetical protein
MWFLIRLETTDAAGNRKSFEGPMEVLETNCTEIEMRKMAFSMELEEAAELTGVRAHFHELRGDPT